MKNILNNIPKKNLFIIGGIVLAIIVIISVICITIYMCNKPNKDKAKQVVEEYIAAMTEGNGEKMISTIDSEGYIIFKEDKEKNFDKNYKNKSDFVNNYLAKNEISDLNLAKQRISAEFESKFGYYKYSMNEITGIDNSDVSKNIIIVRCKIELRSNRYNTLNTARFYLLKN